MFELEIGSPVTSGAITRSASISSSCPVWSPPSTTIVGVCTRRHGSCTAGGDSAARSPTFTYNGSRSPEAERDDAVELRDRRDRRARLRAAARRRAHRPTRAHRFRSAATPRRRCTRCSAGAAGWFPLLVALIATIVFLEINVPRMIATLGGAACALLPHRRRGSRAQRGGALGRTLDAGLRALLGRRRRGDRAARRRARRLTVWITNVSVKKVIGWTIARLAALRVPRRRRAARRRARPLGPSRGPRTLREALPSAGAAAESAHRRRRGIPAAARPRRRAHRRARGKDATTSCRRRRDSSKTGCEEARRGRGRTKNSRDDARTSTRGRRRRRRRR